MAIEKNSFGKMPDGTEVYKYTLTNKNGVSASFITLGGVWVSMVVPDKDGIMADVVLGYDDLDSYRRNPAHFGAPIGRNANRIGGAVITIDGKDYKLEANNGPNNLHSGPDLYHDRVWDCAALETEAGSRLDFYLESPDGDQGYPGNARITVSYTLTDEDSLVLDYHMVCDKDTVANFTNHSYFNLAGHDSGDVMKQEVWLNASRYTPADEVSIPTGEIAPVAGTPMDFTEMKAIGRDIGADFEALVFGKGYDHNWVLDKEEGELALAARPWTRPADGFWNVIRTCPESSFIQLISCRMRCRERAMPAMITATPSALRPSIFRTRFTSPSSRPLAESRGRVQNQDHLSIFG